MTLFDAAEVRSGEQLQVKVKVSNLWFAKEDNVLGGNVCAQNVHLWTFLNLCLSLLPPLWKVKNIGDPWKEGAAGDGEDQVGVDGLDHLAAEHWVEIEVPLAPAFPRPILLQTAQFQTQPFVLVMLVPGHGSAQFLNNFFIIDIFEKIWIILIEHDLP